MGTLAAAIDCQKHSLRATGLLRKDVLPFDPSLLLLVIVAEAEAVLSFHQLVENADECFLLDNEALPGPQFRPFCESLFKIQAPDDSP